MIDYAQELGCSPGNWAVQFHENTNKPRAIKADGEEHVTYVDDSRYYDQQDDPEAKINAILMSASPDLYNICKSIMNSPGIHSLSDIQKRELQKAISKAENVNI